MVMANIPALTFLTPLSFSALYKSEAKIAYSTMWADFLTIKSFQYISDALAVGYEEKRKITKAQMKGGAQNLIIFWNVFTFTSISFLPFP